MKVKKLFRALRGLIGAMRLYALPSPLHTPTAHKRIHTALHTMCPLPSIFLDPPLYMYMESGMGNRSTFSYEDPYNNRFKNDNKYSNLPCKVINRDTCDQNILIYILILPIPYINAKCKIDRQMCVSAA